MPVFLSTGSTALHICAATGREPLCITLLVAQQQRHPGLELRRMRNSRGMTPLNIALLCGHRHLAPLLVAGGTFHAPMLPGGGRGGAVGSSTEVSQMPPQLRLQLLSLVHRAQLLSQLRLLGLGSGAAHVPALAWEAPGAIQRLEELLLSDTATADQVLEALDELLRDTGPAGLDDSGGRSSLFEAPLARGRRQQRQAEERQEVAQALASAQAGVDWSLLDRNQSLWHAEHSSSLYRRQACAAAPACRRFAVSKQMHASVVCFAMQPSDRCAKCVPVLPPFLLPAGCAAGGSGSGSSPPPPQRLRVPLHTHPWWMPLLLFKPWLQATAAETVQAALAAPAAAATAPLPAQAMQSSSRHSRQEQRQGSQHWRRLQTARLMGARCAQCAWTARLASCCHHAGTAPA
jgi:hypothetical protein